MATGNPATTAAAVQVLQRGGNAVDAAVAAGFASAVCEPGLTSLAGGGFANLLLPDGSHRLLDFFTSVPGLDHPGPWNEPATITVVYPSATQNFRVGPAAAAVPGILPGYLALHRAHGRLPLVDVVAPSVDLATFGARVDSSQAYILQLIESIVRHTPSAESVYAPEGPLLREGDLLVDADLADFLSLVGSGDVADMTAAPFAQPLLGMPGCHVTATDLAAYEPLWRRPLVSSTRRWTLLTNPSPAFGGEIIARAVDRVDAFSFEALTRALRDATEAVKQQPAATTGTTQISVADAAGAVVSLTTTNGAGGGVLIPGTGIHLNNMLGEDDLLPGGIDSVTPGERLRSMAAPSILIAPDGAITALGSGGSARIRSAIAAVVVRLRDGGETLDEAIAGPRAHLEETGVVQAEVGLSAESLAQLRATFDVNVWDVTDFYFGGVNAVQRRADGSVLAVGDARRNGSVAIVAPA